MRVLWLAYLAFVFIEPFLSGATPGVWAWTLASVAAFLVLYAGVFTVGYENEAIARVLVVAMGALALALLPVNSGAITYAIYSAAIVGFVVPPRSALAYVGGLFLLQAAAAAWLHPRMEVWIWTQLAFIPLVGISNIAIARDQRRNLLLRRAQEHAEQMAVVAERERIARDLHDLLGHTLSVIALKSELASRLADIDPQRAAVEIRDVERVSRETLAEVRAAVEGYRGRGLAGELQNARRALDAAGIRVDADVSNVPLPPRQETVLALALREAVTNIVRHSGATACRISLSARSGAAIFLVADDGRGGDVREGHGLSGMRERVGAVGGTITLDGGPGFLVRITLPLALTSDRLPGAGAVLSDRPGAPS